MLTNPRYGLIARQSVARFRTVFWLGAALAGVAAFVVFAVDELKTSRLQSGLWHDYARDARFSVDAGDRKSVV